MEDPIPVHVVDGLQQLVSVMLNSLFWQVIWAALDCLVHVLLHELENKREATCRLIVQDFNELDDVRVRVQPLEGLNLT